MSNRYSVAEARANLPKILDEVELGREIELTRRGKPIAVVVSVDEYERLAGGQRNFGEAYDEHRRKFGGLAQADLEGLRDPDTGRKVRL